DAPRRVFHDDQGNDDGAGGDRNRRGPLERGKHLPGNALVPRPGDDARLEGEGGAADGAVPVRAVHGGSSVVLPVAPAVRPGGGRGGGGGAGEDRRALRGSPHRRKALAVAGMGFCPPRLQAGLCKTRAALLLLAAARPGSRCLISENGQKSNLEAVSKPSGSL